MSKKFETDASPSMDFVPPPTEEAVPPPKGELKGNRLGLSRKWIAILLALALGIFGMHNFYLGYDKKAKIQVFLTLTGVGIFISSIWVYVDIIMLLIGKISVDSDGNSLK